MSATPRTPRPTFAALEQTDFQRLKHAAYLKGFLQPFNGKGSLEDWASQCAALREGVIALAVDKVLPQARAHPFNLLPVQLAQQTTSAGTTFLRWRNLDRSAMGVALWQKAMTNAAIPDRYVEDFYAMELQRIALNMQISLMHSMVRQAIECAGKMAQAETIYRQRIARGAVSTTPKHQTKEAK